jgi:RimJ/RimL family protein N-acetyltransferase
MSEPSDEDVAVQRRRDQMLKLVAKGFYNELINYGVRKDEVLKVTSHLLDNLLTHASTPGPGLGSYNKIFTLASVDDDWATGRQLRIQEVSLRPMDVGLLPHLVRWLRDPAIRDSFVPAFPESLESLRQYFADPTREYFGIYFNGAPVGIVGGENIDRASGKLEMKKLVGESGLQGKGIGKYATFGFLYYSFNILNIHKVYIHSRDINIRNINLNSQFGFQLEGVFFEDLRIGDKRQDIVRMALLKPQWLEIFGGSTAAGVARKT